MSQSDQNSRIDYVELAAADIGASKKFYEIVFGWVFTDYGDAYSAFTDGRMSGGLRLEVEPPGKGALVVIYATDLERMEAAVKANGGVIVKDIFAFPGGRRFHFTDPANNELAVWSDQ